MNCKRTWSLRRLTLCSISVVGTPVLAAPGDGFVRVGRAAAPPTIDGVLTDACWQRTVEITPFVLQRQRAFAREQAKVYMTYDQTSLYVAFHCEQRCLDPVNNQLGAFRAETREHDSDRIFKDDCVLMLLDTNSDGDSFYDLCVNGAGTVCDSVCAGENPWSTRDKRWEFGGTAAVAVENGFWTAELALPFAKLGGAPEPGTRWRVCLGRIQQQDRESSAWRPMTGGFHNAEEFSDLMFGMHVPGTRGPDLGAFAAGENRLSVAVHPLAEPTPIRLETCTVRAEMGKSVSFTDEVLSAVKTLTHTYALDQEGRLQFQWSLLDPTSLTLYYRSPAYGVEVTVSRLVAKLNGEGGFTAFLNGKRMLAADGGSTAGGGALVAGVNVIGIEAEGWVEAKFSVGDFTFETDHTWKSAEAPEADWQGRGFSDSDWAQTRARTARLGESGKRRCYRKTLLLDRSRFWPNWSAQALSIARNSVQQLLWVPQGLPGRTLTDFTLYLETPTEFRVVGASGYYGKNHRRNGFLCGNRGEVLRDGRRYRRTMIRALDPVTVQKAIPHWRMCSIAIEAPGGDVVLAEDQVTFYHYLEADAGAICEVPQRLRVTLLPPLRGKQPKTYSWQTTGGSTSVMDDVACGEALMASLTRAGFNGLWHGRPRPRFDAANLAMFGFNSWQIDCRPYLEEHPEHAMIGSDGKPRYNPAGGRRNQIAPSLLLQDTEAWDFLREALLVWVRENDIDHVDWDFEYSVWDDKGGTHVNPIADFGPLALADFRAFCGINADVELTPTIIKASYTQQWIRFMNQRMAQLCGRLRAALKQADPDLVFSAYSGYQCKETHSFYGVDWALLAGNIDMAICGYGRRVNELKATLDALGDTPLVVGDLITPYRAEERAYPTYTSKATFLRRALDGTRGVLVWTFNNLDGRTFHASAEVSRLVADYEGLFVSRRPAPGFVSANGISPGDITVLADDTRRLILLLNETDQPKRVGLTLTAYRPGLAVHDYYADKQLAGGAEFETEVAPNDIKAFVVSLPAGK